MSFIVNQKIQLFCLVLSGHRLLYFESTSGINMFLKRIVKPCCLVVLVSGSIVSANTNISCENDSIAETILTYLSNGNFTAVREIVSTSDKDNALYKNLVAMYEGYDAISKESAFSFVRQAALGECLIASRALGDYFYGKDYVESQKWYEIASSKGDIVSKMSAISIDLLIDGNESRLSELMAMSEGGYASASYNLGIFYSKKKGDESEKLAKSYFQKASESGHAKAMHNLAVFAKKSGDTEAYISLLTQSASQGFWSAEYQYAVELYKGEYVAKDIPKFIHMMDELSQEGIVKASVLLGSHFYENAQSLADYEKAETYYYRAALGGRSDILEWLIVYYKDRLELGPNKLMSEKLDNIQRISSQAEGK
jgi:TPR repeat protein